MSLIDRMIERLWPSWGVERKLARIQLREAEKLVGYPDASPRRFDNSIQARGTAPDFSLELGFDRRRIVDRARQCQRENLLLDSLLERATEVTVGEHGFLLKPKTKDPRWNAEVKDLWDDWCENDADVQGKLTFVDILETMFLSQLRDGDVAAIALAEGRLRITESDEISAPEGGYVRPTEVDGVELDPAGRPIAFHVFNPDPYTLWADRRLVSRRTRVPAEDVFFHARRQRAGQTRGLSALVGAFWLLENLDKIIEATTISTRMQACFGLAIKKTGPYVNLTAGSSSSGRPTDELGLGPGKIQRLQPGEDITPIQPTNGGASFETQVMLLARFCALRMGLPLEIGIFHLGNMNLSSLRGIVGIAKKKWRRNQRPLKRFSSWTYKWKVLNWMKEGRLSYRDDAFAHVWKMPGWPSFEPEAELRAQLGSVDAGFKSKRSVCAENGDDYDEVAEERKLEIDLEKKLGIPVVNSSITRAPGTAAAEAGPAARGLKGQLAKDAKSRRRAVSGGAPRP